MGMFRHVKHRRGVAGAAAQAHVGGMAAAGQSIGVSGPAGNRPLAIATAAA